MGTARRAVGPLLCVLLASLAVAVQCGGNTRSGAPPASQCAGESAPRLPLYASSPSSLTPPRCPRCPPAAEGWEAVDLGAPSAFGLILAAEQVVEEWEEGGNATNWEPCDAPPLGLLQPQPVRTCRRGRLHDMTLNVSCTREDPVEGEGGGGAWGGGEAGTWTGPADGRRATLEVLVELPEEAAQLEAPAFWDAPAAAVVHELEQTCCF